MEYDLSKKLSIAIDLNTYITSLIYKVDFYKIEKQNYFFYGVGYTELSYVLFGGGLGIEYPIKIENADINLFATVDVFNRVFDYGLKYRLKL